MARTCPRRARGNGDPARDRRSPPAGRPATRPRAEGRVRILVVNAGSSSLKLSVLDDDRVEIATTVDRWDGQGDLAPLRSFLGDAPELDAVGHRVVHGGPRYRTSVRVDEDVVD